MSSDDSEIVIRWTGVDATPRRLTFERRSLGGWTRLEERWTGDNWEPVGSEIVTDVAMVAPDSIVVDERSP